MQCLTELTPPTAVTQALHLPFLSPSSSNLVVAKTSLLQIFSLKTVTTEAGIVTRSHGTAVDNLHSNSRREFETDILDQSYLASDVVMQKSERFQSTKLVLVAEYSLAGTILSIARVKTLGSLSGGEALLVAFKDAKVSLVEWDPQRNSISTISIHYYEREDLQGSPWTPPLSQCVNYLTVDPSSRCAAFKFSARNLAILPFHQAGDDLVMDDYDPDIDGDRSRTTIEAGSPGDAPSETQTPYASSFVLPISALEPSLIHPLHLAFLYEYREPTFGILSSQVAPSASLLHERRDILSYTVFTLDLEQRASTTLLSVSSLPYDLYKVIPLPLPVGGALLVGGNQLVHVDQAGKTNGVGVNEFAKQCSSFAMADQSDLSMRLEGCTVEQLGADNGDLLVVLDTGELAVLGFRLDGRSVSGISVRRVAEDHGGLVVLSRASCAAALGRGRLFIGSEDSDSVVLGWARPSERIKRKRSEVGLKIDDENELADEDDIDDDDDLYSGAAMNSQQEPIAQQSQPSADGDYVFRIHDFLTNLAPLSDIALGRPSLIPQTNKSMLGLEDTCIDMDLVSPSGRGRAGGVTVMNREINPKVVDRFDFRDAHGIWCIRTKKSKPKGVIAQPTVNGTADIAPAIDDDFDKNMIVSQSNSLGTEESKVYALMPTGYEEMTGTEFESAAGGTIDVGTLAGETRIVQALRGEIRSYDAGELRYHLSFCCMLSRCSCIIESIRLSNSYVPYCHFQFDQSATLDDISAFARPWMVRTGQYDICEVEEWTAIGFVLKGSIYFNSTAVLLPGTAVKLAIRDVVCCKCLIGSIQNDSRPRFLYICGMHTMLCDRVCLKVDCLVLQVTDVDIPRLWPGPDISHDRRSNGCRAKNRQYKFRRSICPHRPG